MLNVDSHIFSRQLVHGSSMIFCAKNRQPKPHLGRRSELMRQAIRRDLGDVTVPPLQSVASSVCWEGVSGSWNLQYEMLLV